MSAARILPDHVPTRHDPEGVAEILAPLQGCKLATTPTGRYECEDSGWPHVLRRFAAEPWKRAEAGELTDNELYCYQSCKTRIRREGEEIARVFPRLLSDHFAA